jgi:CHASE2 domain-containing sensor protein
MSNRSTITVSCIGIVSMLCSIALFSTDYFESLEMKTQDLFAAFSAVPEPDTGIIVVAIDEPTVNALSWPLTRDYYVSLISICNEYDAACVLFDIAFIDRNKNYPHYDSMLALVSGDSVLGDNIIHGFYFTDTGSPPVTDSLESALRRFAISDARPPNELPRGSAAVLPFPFLAAQMHHAGHLHVVQDTDGRIRRASLLFAFRDRCYPSISLAGAACYHGAVSIDITDNAVILNTAEGQRTIPVDDDGSMRIAFSDDGTSFSTLSLLALLAEYKRAQDEGAISMKLDTMLRGKIVLVGNTAVSLGDFGVIPGNTAIPKVYVHAGALDTILNERFFILTPLWIILGITGVCLALLITAGIFSRIGVFSLWWIGLSGIYCAVTVLLRSFGIIVEVGIPLSSLCLSYLGVSLYRYFTENG